MKSSDVFANETITIFASNHLLMRFIISLRDRTDIFIFILLIFVDERDIVIFRVLFRDGFLVAMNNKLRTKRESPFIDIFDAFWEMDIGE